VLDVTILPDNFSRIAVPKKVLAPGNLREDDQRRDFFRLEERL
jgi:hypothetical protein